MKNIIILTIVLITGAACSSGNAPTNSNQSTAVNHDAMNHGNMNHSSMNHAEMKSAPNAAAAPYDLQFLDTMIAHHEAAVEMAKMVGGQTDNAMLKKFAVRIVAAQNTEIEQMKRWRDEWYKSQPSALNMEMPGMADSMKMEMSKLSAAKNREFDRLFAEMMIPHHEGAVTMSREAQQKAVHLEIKTLAAAIIKDQENEIKDMQNWLAEWKKQ